MNDEFDAAAVIAATGTVVSAGASWYLFMDLNVLVPIIVGGLLAAILIFRRKNRAKRFPRKNKNSRGR